MKKPRGALDRIGRLADTLSEMAASFGYRVVAVFDLLDLGLYVFDKKKTLVATLCDVPREDSNESSAEALLREYESKNSWTAFFYDDYSGLTFPGGSLEEIEFKAAVGVKALFDPSAGSPENLLTDL